jgi:hypothetical protein
MTKQKRSGYGQRGGLGPNDGKKSSTYVGFTSDNQKLTKRSFNVHTPTACIAAYQRMGVWVASGVREVPEDWGTQVWFFAERKESPSPQKPSQVGRLRI